MRIAIFGGLGFAGFSLGAYLKKKYKDYEIYLYDNFSRRGTELNALFAKDHGLTFTHCDIRNKDDLEGIFCDLIIDASADASVQSGLKIGTRKIVDINLNGSLNLLDLAVQNSAGIIFLSTSRVYSIDELNAIRLKSENGTFYLQENQDIQGISSNGINESFSTFGKKSVYGATKYCVEQIIQEYKAFLGIEAIINRFGVLAGPGQFGKIDQGILMYWLFSHYWKKPLAYIGFGGKGCQVRDFLHIHDFCTAIDVQIHQFKRFEGKTFNIGGGIKNSASLAQLSELASELTGNKLDIKSIEEGRKADIPWYVTDNSLFNSVSNWSPQKDVRQTMIDGFHWLNKNDLELSKLFN